MLKKYIFHCNIGLDPAGPLFGTDIGIGTLQIDNYWRLDPSDAKYVQCIETSYLGIDLDKYPCGHANFEMYGAKRQPVCKNYDLLTTLTSCDHSSATYYFQLAMDPKNEFYGIKKKCKDRCYSQENTDKIGVFNAGLHGSFKVI